MRAALYPLFLSFLIPALCYPVLDGGNEDVLLRLRSTAKAASADQSGSLASSLMNSAGLSAFLGTHDSVVVQNAMEKNGSACAVMTVLFARGTGEPGNLGVVTGPPFFAALASYMNGTNQLAIQGVDYDASISGFLEGGSTQGASTMAGLVNSTLATCPSTTLMLSGYSQGAQVVHLAAASLPANVTSKISSVVLFGDPKNGTAVTGVAASKVMTICHTGDDICAGGDTISLQHLTYGFGNDGADVQNAAMFALGGMAQKGITSVRMGKVAVGNTVIG